MYRLREPSSGRIDQFYLVKSWEGEPEIKEPDKCDEARWYPINDLPENTIHYIKFVLDRICNSPDNIISWSEYTGR